MRTKINIFPTNLRPECAGNALQKEKILRPECGAEVPTFLSAVYNQRYTREKLASRYKQSGRSMIEMLGVLAIIGVLTVGSITGYSKAMRRHLLNKQREQYSYILSAVETHHDMININTPNLPAHFTSVLKTFGWIPEEMIKDNGIHIYDVLKNAAHFYKGEAYMGLDISLNTPNAYEQCTNLYQVMKQYHAFLWATDVRKQNDGAKYGPSYYGDQYCTGNLNCIRDLTPAKISQLCQFCNDTEDNYCILYILWK